MNTTHYLLLQQFLTKQASNNWYATHKDQAKQNRVMWYMTHKEQAAKKAKRYRALVDAGIIRPQARAHIGNSFVVIGYK